ncbi:MAG: type II toxin-antitoxin system PrlF family antitoxin [Candidatus Omnitrophica bacterium]|nr:type II toxin-antitoxin system PrlF family antitoxin [Candidatus Omnitrophota bacterium]MCA9424594.1 type II toxin-antitoxin system PrlF family antitoxin [Candidatus Omnitrophota bacterium]MCA9435150.1 type II toxin-antitoxin system PrlF family antitoxin [Candidatus Omnitrophota bacterium]MCA9440951.1 type II toxin-antitoxin system PrlF family antitoxin [Candidatus Omnitrophota bacterium]
MRVTTKGQVTIPAHIRGYLGIEPHSEVDFEIRNGEVVLKKTDEEANKSNLARFARMRGILKGGPTTDEWLKATRGD